MFVHLNTHSYYSLGWGTASPEALCHAARDMGCPALALTETNNLYPLYFFLNYARDFRIRPIVGAEIVTADSRAVLLVRDRSGYANLCRLLTARHNDPEFNLLCSLTQFYDGLVVLTDSVPLLKALPVVTDLVFAELVRGGPVRELLRTCRLLNIKPVATTRAFWVNPDNYELHRLLRAVASNRTLNDLPPGLSAPETARLCDESEMRDAFSFCPEAVDNTNEVADLCRWEPDFGTVYPEVKPGMNGNAAAVLNDKAFKGARERYGAITPDVRNRLEYELGIIAAKGFSPVFLVVEDIINRFPLTCGRGSAAASLVSYCLGITHVDPLRHELFFERFINEARDDPPDIDVDFAWDERDAVLDYVFNRYGKTRAAMVANHVTFQKRAAIREVAKVFGLPDAEIGAVTKRLSHGFSFISTPVSEHPALRDHGFPDPWGEILRWADRLEDIPRHLSVHCGGVVITPGETSEWVPTETAAKGVRIIQWEKDQTEESGLVKIDLLGNRSLAVIRDTIAAVNEHYGLDLNYSRLNPLDDPATQELLKRGDTMGVFYVESPATRLLQKKAGVGDYEHLVLHSSIIRPAANPFINQYLRRLKGEPYEPLHPLIGDLLDDNYGIMVYQEDVTRVAMQLAGFSLAEAEELRRIISKKHKHRRLADLRRRFYDGALARGVSTETVDRVWEMIMSFSGYSFCKPHSASYALVSFKSAYLKAHYPAEFMAAVISNQGGFYSTFAYISEARRLGLEILPPDVNASEIRYTGSDGQVRVGLMQIKGLTEEARELVVEERRRGRYQNFSDLLERTRLHPADAKLLVKAGCCDRLEPGATRPELFWRLTLENDRRDSRERGIDGRKQSELFPTEPLPTPRTPEYDAKTLLAQEVETLGFLMSRHPLELYRERLDRLSYVPACDLHRFIGKRIWVIGWLITGKVVTTKKREPMEFVTFEDTTGLIETTFFPASFRSFSHILSHTRPYRLFGKVEEDFGAVTLTVETVKWL